MYKESKLLLVIIVAVVLKQLAWISFIPLWHFPDEQAHFGQIAYWSELGKRQLGNDLSKEIYLSEVILQTNRDWAGNNRFTYHPEYNISYTNSYFGRNEQEILGFPLEERKQMAKIESTFYPPAYYLIPTYIYKIFYSTDLFTRVFLVRISNILYSIFIAVTAFKIFIDIFKNKLYALSGAVLVSFQPMFSFVQAGINSDNLFNLLFMISIFLSIKVIQNGIKIKYFFGIILLFLVTFYTKPQAYFLFIPFSFLIFYFLIILKSWKVFISMILLTLVTLSPTILKAIKGVQFLPDIGFNNSHLSDITIKDHFIWSLKHTYREVLPWYWGVFRWLSLTLPRIVNRVLNYFVLVSSLGLVLYIIRAIKNRKLTEDLIVSLFFIWVVLGYFLTLTGWDYIFTKTHGFSFGIQGRYYFPVIVPITGILLYGIKGITLLNKLRNIILVLLGVGIVVIHQIGLIWVISSYFNPNNLITFFITASQYKPVFFKSPVLQYIILAQLVSAIYIIYLLINQKNEKN